MPVECLSYHEINGSFVKGKVDLLLVSLRLRINGCDLCQTKDGKRFVRLPNRAIKNGEATKWVPVCEFAHEKIQERFSSEAIDAIDRYLANIDGIDDMP